MDTATQTPLPLAAGKAAETRYTFAQLSLEQRREAIDVAMANGRANCIGLEFMLTADGHVSSLIDVLTKHKPSPPSVEP